MTLHEAIRRLLFEAGGSLTTKEIAILLNKNGWYKKKDNSVITSFQIHGRVKNYPKIFHMEGSRVSLMEHLKSQDQVVLNNNKLIPIKVVDNKEVGLVEKVLLNEKNFKAPGGIDGIVPDEPGLYCVRIPDVECLPEPFKSYMVKRNHNILYIGIATQSLKRRFLNQELRAIGHGTFFRSVGAVLGYRPQVGSLLNKTNKRNYKFIASDELEIIEWLNTNTKVNWVAYNGGLGEFETDLIQRYLPLFNIANNPSALIELSELRRECVRIANQS
jgi:hypothetical protein